MELSHDSIIILFVISISVSVLAILMVLFKQVPVTHFETGLQGVNPNGSLSVRFNKSFDSAPFVQITPLILGQDKNKPTDVCTFQITNLNADGFDAKQTYFSATDSKVHYDISVADVLWSASPLTNGSIRSIQYSNT
jgi:hypothetical protein